MDMTRILSVLEESKVYLLLTLNQLSFAIFMILVESVISAGISALAIVVYEHVIATVILCLLAFFLEKITLCQMLLTMSLQFIASTYQSVVLNLVPSLVFIMAVLFGQEKLRCWNINGQAKIWGLLISVAGALALVLWKGPVVLTSIFFNIKGTTDGVLGSVMIIVAVLATSFWNILVGRVIQFYPAELSLMAMMSLFGTIQTAIVTAFVISWSSWKLKWDGGLVLVTILLGVSQYMHTR